MTEDNFPTLRFGGGPVAFSDFAAKHGLKVSVKERSARLAANHRLPRYYASFDHVEIMGRGMLSSASGNGETPDEAVHEYAKAISGSRLAIQRPGCARITVDCPNELTFPDDSKALRFPGPTPMTVTSSVALDELRDACAFIGDAKRLIAQGRFDKARFELQMAARHIGNAQLWCGT